MKDLKPEYRILYVVWIIFIKPVCKFFAWGWRNYPMVHFPLIIDIELGETMYFFFKYGFKATIVRIRYYNEYLAKRIERSIKGEEEEDIISEFLTEEAKLRTDLNEEMNELCSEW